MVRLIVDDAGARKAVRLPQGRCSVGSGEGVALKLTAAGVAAKHLELVVTGEVTEVRVVADAPAVTLGGRMLAPGAQATWTAGSELVVGGARLTVQAEGAPAAAPAASAPAAAAPVRASRASAAAPGARARAGKRASAAGRGARGSGRRDRALGSEDGAGRPVWVIPAIGIAVIVAAVVGYRFMFGGVDRGLYYSTDVVAIRDHIQNQKYDLARKLWDELAASRSLDPEQRKVVEELGAQLQAGEAMAAGGGQIMAGHEWKDKHLDGYVTANFAAPPFDPSKVRVLHERVQQFRSLFPGHPTDPELAATLDRVGASSVVAQPLTAADIAYYEQFYVTRLKSPKSYRRVIEAADRFLANAPAGAERTEVEERKKRLVDEQAALTEDILARARKNWEDQQEQPAVAALAEAITYVANDEMSATAAKIFAALPNAADYVKSYASRGPEIHEALMAQPAIAAVVAEAKQRQPEQ